MILVNTGLQSPPNPGDDLHQEVAEITASCSCARSKYAGSFVSYVGNAAMQLPTGIHHKRLLLGVKI